MGHLLDPIWKHMQEVKIYKAPYDQSGNILADNLSRTFGTIKPILKP